MGWTAVPPAWLTTTVRAPTRWAEGAATTVSHRTWPSVVPPEHGRCQRDPDRPGRVRVSPADPLPEAPWTAG